MKFKASAIALAVAGTVAAPMAVQAEGSVYASARIGIMSIDSTGAGGVSSDDNLSVSSYSSRFGMKGETDLGNGMTGFGKYEFGVRDFGNPGKQDGLDEDGDASDDKPLISARHQIVGVKGDFGKITLGQTYHPFYNHVVGPLDTPWAGSGYAMIGYTGRTGNIISYDGGSGGVTFGIGIQMGHNANDEDIDQTEVALTFGIGDMDLGIGYIDAAESSVGGDDPDAIIAVALSGIGLGSTSWGVSFQSQDDDISYVIDGTMGGLYFHYEVADFDDASVNNDPGLSPSSITLGYTQSLGRNTTAWYEIMELDADTADGDGDSTNVRAVLKYDIL